VKVRNGDFTDAGELVWSKAPSRDAINTGTFTVPTGTSLSSVRIRVSMKYNDIPTSCETFTYGEVEDYTVNLTEGGGGDPNPPTGYCDSNGNNTNDEFISNVQLGSINNSTSAETGGYGDYTSLTTNLGATNTITVTPTWTGTVYPEAYAVWIDYNRDGDFGDANELVWSKNPSTDTVNTGTFTVPSGASEGATVMRVSMKYNDVPTSCESFTYGEVEDYVVVIGSSSRTQLLDFTRQANGTIKLYPNPASTELNIEILAGSYEEITIFSTTGAIAKKINPNKDALSINVSEFPSGIYFVRFVSKGLAITKRFIKR